MVIGEYAYVVVEVWSGRFLNEVKALFLQSDGANRDESEVGRGERDGTVDGNIPPSERTLKKRGVATFDVITIVDPIENICITPELESNVVREEGILTIVV